MVLLSGRLFNARAHVDTPGPDALDRGKNVARVQATGDHHFHWQPGGHRPIESQPTATVGFPGGTVEQNGLPAAGYFLTREASNA